MKDLNRRDALVLAAVGGTALFGGAALADEKPTAPRGVKEIHEIQRKQERDAKLASAVVNFHTNDDDKDWDTALTISLSQGAQVLAKTAQPITGNFPDNTDNGPFGLAIQGAVSRQDVQGAVINIHIDPVGNDTWRFNMHLALTFNDGTVQSYQWNGQVIDQDNKDVSRQL